MAFLHRVADDIRALKDLLKRYDFGNDGRSIYKELLQNADDAKATTIQLHLMDQGFGPEEVENPLLTGPALVTVNNGRFRPIDAKNMRYATGTSKSQDTGAVGRFGLGQKSVFHLCEAWFCVGSSSVDGFIGCNMDPWEHPEDGDADFPDWPRFTKGDQDAIRERLAPFLSGDDWFVLWLPLRQRAHRRLRSGAISDWYPDVPRLRADLADLSPLARLLPQMGTLRRLEVHHHSMPGDVAASTHAATAPGATTLSRPTASDRLDRPFGGEVATDRGAFYAYAGVELVELGQELAQLRAHAHWPKTLIEEDDGEPVEIAEQIVPHGAVTVVVGAPSERASLALDWCVFLPMADQSSTIPLHPRCGHSVWIRLHGYFFPDHGRRHVTGFSDDQLGGEIRHSKQFEAAWNRHLRDAVVLPCFLKPLHDALRGLPSFDQLAVASALRSDAFFAKHRDAICREWILVQGLDGAQPLSLVSPSTRLLPVPATIQDEARAVRRLLRRAEESADAVLVVRAGPHLTPLGTAKGWTREHLALALAPPFAAQLDHAPTLGALVELIEHIDDGGVRDEAASRMLWAALREHGPRVFRSKRLVEMWKRLVACLSTTGVLATREPSALVHISHLDLSTLVLPSSIVEPGTAHVTLDDGRQILEVLSQVIEGQDSEDAGAAGRLAAEVVAAMGAAAVLSDDRLRTLPVFRVWSGRLGSEESLSPARILELKGLQVAYQGTGGFARQKCLALFGAIATPGVDVVLVDEAIAGPLDLPEITEENLLRPLLTTRDLALSAVAADRRDLLGRLLSSGVRKALDPGEPGAVATILRQGIRYVLHGNAEQRRTDGALWKAGETQGLDHDAVRLVFQARNEEWTLITEELTQDLSDQWMRVLGMKTLGQHELLLAIQGLDMAALAQIGRGAGDGACACLLRVSAAHLEIWRALPLHLTVDRRRVALTNDRAWLESSDWQVPESLRGRVDLIAKSDEPVNRAAQQDHIRPWSPAAQVYTVLGQEDPSSWALECLEGLAVLELNSWPRSKLASVCWLPTCRSSSDDSGSENGTAVSPDCLLGLSADAALRVAGFLGGHTEAFLAPSEVAEPVRAHSAFPLVVRELALRGEHLVQAVALELNGKAPIALALGQGAADAFPFEVAMRSEGLARHRGWALVQALHAEMAASDSLRTDLLPVLSFHMDREDQIAVLNALGDSAERTGQPQCAGEFDMYLSCLAVAATRTDFLDEILTMVRVPNQEGRWVEPFQVARSGDNWTLAYRLDDRVRAVIDLVLEQAPIGDAETSSLELVGEKAPTAKDLTDAASVLEHFFDPLFRHGVRQEAVGLLVAMMGVGSGGALRRMADEWLSVTPAESLWDWVLHKATTKNHLAMDNDHRTLLDARYAVRVMSTSAGLVRTTSLLGTPLDAALASGMATDTLFAGLGTEGVGSTRPYWLRLLTVDPNLPREEVYELLRRSFEAFVQRRLRRTLKAAEFEPRWRELSESGQVQLSAVRQQILENLATRLEGLSYKRHTALAQAVSSLKRAKQRAAEADSTFRDLHWKEKRAGPRDEAVRAQAALEAMVEHDPEVHAFLLGQIRKKLEDYQYGPDRVLWELLQNADDAAVQLREMLSRSAGNERVAHRFRIEAAPGQVRITHWGRQINQHTLAGFHDGRHRGWDLDLLNMMVLNTSDKMPEHGTTGHFGLGFKSVYLVTDRPRVGSGQLAFEVVAGMLPTAIGQTPVRDEEWSRQEPPTVFELDLDRPELLDKILRDLEAFGGLAPLFCRALSEIELVRGAGRAIAHWEPHPVPGVDGMWTGVGSTGLGASSPRTRLVQLADGRGEIDVVLSVTDGQFRLLAPEVPSLWCTAPTKENWNLGFALNGPMAVDTGRSRVALDRRETLEVIERAGQLVCRCLGSLFVAMEDDWDAVAPHLGLPSVRSEGVARAFWASAWTVLAQSWKMVQGSEDARVELVRRMHSGGNGLLGLVRRHPALPTGLPGAFDVLTRLDRVRYVATAELEERRVLDGVSSWRWVDASFAPGAVISGGIFDVLRGLQPDISRPVEIGLMEVLKRWGTPRGAGLSLERALELHQLVDWLGASFLRSETSAALLQWMGGLVFPSQGKHGALSSKLLLPPLSAEVTDELRTLGEGDRLRNVEDEFLRAGFAPSERLLSAELAGDARAVRFFLASRRLQAGDRSELERWAREAQLPQRQEAALRYCVSGVFGHALCERFREQPLSWFPDRTALGSDLLQRWSIAEKIDLQNALFPYRVLDIGVVESPLMMVPHTTVRSFFDNFKEWWDRPEVRHPVLEEYERSAWPGWLRPGLADHLRDDSADHWLGLLVLGACRSLGWSDSSHHRRFVEEAHSRGWWATFSRAGDDAAWMGMLRTWQDESVSKLEYAKWMALFPAIYQLSRYLPKYRRLLRTAPVRPAEMYQIRVLLAPKVDERLSGAGSQFDAPPAPLNMGLHWVLRELVRLGAVEPAGHVLPDCWVPGAQVIDFLRPLGLELPDNAASNPDKAREIFSFLADRLATDEPHLHLSFDVPLRHVAGNAKLRKKLGLED